MSRRIAVLGLLVLVGTTVGAQQPPQATPEPKPPQAGSARANAQVDLIGYWVSLITEDWRFRMVTPPKGDFASLPISFEGRQLANTWDPSKDGSCLAYGAAGLMRMPTRVHITWEDDYTLKLETDAGQQTRLLRFRPPSTAVERSLQGSSIAEWMRSGGGGGFFGGFAGFGATGGGQKWAPLKVVTTQLTPGWLRRNGVPYSESTRMTEYFLRLSETGDDWLTISTTVEDPKYLISPLITSSNFKREPDGSKWKPVPCKAG